MRKLLSVFLFSLVSITLSAPAQADSESRHKLRYELDQTLRLISSELYTNYDISFRGAYVIPNSDSQFEVVLGFPSNAFYVKVVLDNVTDQNLEEKKRDLKAIILREVKKQIAAEWDTGDALKTASILSPIGFNGSGATYQIKNSTISMWAQVNPMDFKASARELRMRAVKRPKAMWMNTRLMVSKNEASQAAKKLLPDGTAAPTVAVVGFETELFSYDFRMIHNETPDSLRKTQGALLSVGKVRGELLIQEESESPLGDVTEYAVDRKFRFDVYFVGVTNDIMARLTQKYALYVANSLYLGMRAIEMDKTDSSLAMMSSTQGTIVFNNRWFITNTTDITMGGKARKILNETSVGVQKNGIGLSWGFGYRRPEDATHYDQYDLTPEGWYGMFSFLLQPNR